MKNLIFIALLSTSVFSFISCSKSDPGAPVVCGGPLEAKLETNVSKAVIVSSASQWTSDNILTTLDGNQRSYKIRLGQNGLCSRKISSVAYELQTTGYQGTSVVTDVVARAEWGEGKSKDVYLCQADGNMKKDYSYQASISLDMNSDYTSGQGGINTYLIVKFTSLGSEALDNLYFQNKISAMKISVSGYHPL